ncbi:class I SAM-dependent methyltransferase [Methanobrevibacter sp. DSM 116169]|uniref:class I SAM-dependent methyltransferase n=1 Tax=Methanobrevibacter sp. DSM 116169 TaxID=3242727 RepID=UPI0038FD00D4
MSIKEKFDEAAEEYDKNRKHLIPCFDDFYGIATEIIDFNGDNPKVLDLGAGTGLFSKFILDKFPNANITLVDLSEEMLNKAKIRFNDNKNITYICDDYLNLDFNNDFDIIISSLSIHHLEEDDKKKLYMKCFDYLKSNGIFINADQVLSSSEKLENIFKYNLNQKILNSPLDKDYIKVADERRKFDKPSTLLDQLKWLKEIGFKDLGVPYKYYIFAIIYAEK